MIAAYNNIGINRESGADNSEKCGGIIVYNHSIGISSQSVLCT